MQPSHNPAITVLMPAYNAGAYIREAIDSILGQTFPDFEFLIIDDGSKDDSLKIIRSYDDPRIRIVSRPNKGLIGSLNEGIALARAPIIARHDADDVCLPQRLERQLAFLQANPDYVVVGSDAAYMDKDGNYISPLAAPIGHSDAELRQRIFEKCPFIHPTVLFRKEDIIAAGGYPKNALLFEDWLLWTRVMQQHKVCNMPEVLIHVRINPESVTIDERWRPKAFHEIRLRSLQQGSVSDEDAVQLLDIIKGQDFSQYKAASYHAYVAKKLLWDNPRPKLARQHLRQVMRHYPKSREAYMLYLLSYLPSSLVQRIYKAVKSQ